MTKLQIPYLKGKFMTVKHDSRVFELECEIVSTLAKSFDTPRALTVALLIRYKEWDQLLDLSINPDDYLDVDSFESDYQITSMLQKNPRVPSSHNKKDRAIAKFYDAETLCGQTNARIQNFREDPDSLGSDIISLILRIQHIIQRILSAYPNRNDLDYAERNMRFGPGATTSLSGVVTSGAKFKKRILDCTEELVSFRAFSFPEIWKETAVELNVRNFSKLTTVPKNAKIDRVICIEPDLNIYVQLGIGALIRKKLREFGLDLSTQDNNRLLAEKAVERGLATVDLSSASDTISKGVVSLLLPFNWVELLAYARVPSTSVEGNVIELQKWSSMGNGYTFELETLIFYATALAVTDESKWDSVITYGDDIILPVESLPSLERALDFLGFKVNKDKTFGKGLFRESCGADFFDGHNVRPFFLRTKHEDYRSVCYLYANSVRRWSRRRNGGDSCDIRYLPTWIRCFTAVDSKYRFRIPEGFGDGGFISSFDESTPRLARRRDGWGGYEFDYLRTRALEKVVSPIGAYFSFLSGKVTEFSSAMEALRGRYLQPKKASGYVFDWPDLGPWL